MTLQYRLTGHVGASVGVLCSDSFCFVDHTFALDLKQATLGTTLGTCVHVLHFLPPVGSGKGEGVVVVVRMNGCW